MNQPSVTLAKASMDQKLQKVFAPHVSSTILFKFRKSQSEKNTVEVDNLRKESVDTQADFNTPIEEKL